MTPQVSRRHFLQTSTLAGATALVLRQARSAFAYPANETLNVGLVGVAGRGSWFVDAIPGLKENVVAMCDVNERPSLSPKQRGRGEAPSAHGQGASLSAGREGDFL